MEVRFGKSWLTFLITWIPGITVKQWVKKIPASVAFLTKWVMRNPVNAELFRHKYPLTIYFKILFSHASCCCLEESIAKLNCLSLNLHQLGASVGCCSGWVILELALGWERAERNSENSSCPFACTSSCSSLLLN